MQEIRHELCSRIVVDERTGQADVEALEMTHPNGTKAVKPPTQSCSVEDLLGGLNPAQRAAVTSPASVVQVLAPPGSGKTKTLTSRVAFLIAHHGFNPRNIIVCTFTVKAAREMKERIAGYLGEDLSKKLILGTFHSISRRYLAAYGSHIGLDEKFGIADSSDSMAIIKRIVKKLQVGIEPGVARSRISSLKAKNMTVEQYIDSLKKPNMSKEQTSDLSEGQNQKADESKKIEAQEFATIYAEYQEQLRVSNLLDFDDLLLRCVDLLRKLPACVSMIDAVLVDEFQDTSNVQFDLLELFAQRHRRITTVGDPDQSIYGWRSAEVGNLEKMHTLHPDTHVAKLEENYRSSGAILNAAHEIIQQDQARPEKPLIPTHSVGLSPVLRILEGAATEARWIVAEILRSAALSAGLFNYSDYAVLLRSAKLSRLIESELGRAGVPYRMVGGLKFYDRIEVKIVLDYLRVICHPEHNDALARIANIPSRGIGDTMNKLLEETATKTMPLWSFVLAIVQEKTRPESKISSQALKGLAAFTSLILRLQRRLKTPPPATNTLSDYLEYVIKEIGLYSYLTKTKGDEAEARWANVEELVAQASDASSETAEEELSAAAASDDMQAEKLEPGKMDSLDLQAVEEARMGALEEAMTRFLANVALAADSQKEDEGDVKAKGQITISTMHAAKGLEWPVVFIPAAYEGSIPHSRAEDTDEERRLLYVAMTRAQALLYLSVPKQSSLSRETEISQFLSPDELIRLVSPQGPRFSFETVKEISCILRRPCPVLKDVEGARTKAEYIYDDVEPVLITTSEGYDLRQHPSGCIGGAERDAVSFKRPRLDTDHGRNSMWIKSGQNRDRLTMPAFKSVTTMQHPDGYSIANTTIRATFVNASTLSIEEIKRKSTSESSHSLPSSNSETLSKQSKLDKSKVAQGQTSLNTFFKKPRIEGSKIVVSDDPGAAARSSSAVANEPLQDGSYIANRARSFSKNHELIGPPSIDFKPPVLLHTTSMAQLHRPPHQRKTLGMKRSLQGWAPRTNYAQGH